jgi:hypothetical protein
MRITLNRQSVDIPDELSDEPLLCKRCSDATFRTAV